MTDVARDESETGKFSMWIHIKNWVSDYLKPTDLNIDGSKNVGVQVQNMPTDYPSIGTEDALVGIQSELNQKLETQQLNIDGSKNVGVNVKTITDEDPDAATKNNPITTLSYNGDGQLSHIAITFNVTIWVKTLTYTSGRLAAISAWVKQ